MSGLRTVRVDAFEKISGSAVYAADVAPVGVCELVLVRSTVPHARIVGVDVVAAAGMPGVVKVITGSDVGRRLWGRRMSDVPILAIDVVRFVGEPVAAVVAETQLAAEAAARLVEVDYEPLDAIFDAAMALDTSSPAVHSAPWAYAGAPMAVGSHNVQSLVQAGDRDAVEVALNAATHVVDRRYTTPRGHQGYIEPQACVAAAEPNGDVRLWVANKSPYRLRAQLASCFDMDPEQLVIHPVMIGGDFGGKGSPMLAPICIEASRRTGRPVRAVLRFNEDLAATNPRHSSSVRVRAGCDDNGQLVAMAVDALFDGGAYGGFKPLPDLELHGAVLGGSAYSIPSFWARSTIAYTNSVPSGHMRAPGSPQVIFAVESAIDELAGAAGRDPTAFRRENLLAPGQANIHGIVWPECRGREVLDAALAAYTPVASPVGWISGRGLAVHDGQTRSSATSIRLHSDSDGTLVAEVPFPETGTGSHTAVRSVLARALDLPSDRIQVHQAATDRFPEDPGVGGSWVTASLTEAAYLAATAWRTSGGEPVTVTGRGEEPDVTSFTVQIAQVAVDETSGECRVLQLLTALDVAEVVNPLAHQLQIDGGSAMGFGFAMLEDLDAHDGQVWAGTLGEFRLPAANDVPRWQTVLVLGGRGLGPSNVKAIGEMSNVATAAAIANAVADAVGARVRDLPVTAERVWRESQV